MHNKALMLIVAAVTVLAVAGYITASPKADNAQLITFGGDQNAKANHSAPAGYQNGKANHHPVAE